MSGLSLDSEEMWEKNKPLYQAITIWRQMHTSGKLKGTVECSTITLFDNAIILHEF